MIRKSQDPQHFYYWREGYWGPLIDDEDDRFRSVIFGFDNTPDRAADHRYRDHVSIPRKGAVFGYVQGLGAALVKTSDRSAYHQVNPGEFFVGGNGVEILFPSAARIVAIQQVGYEAIPLVGGPIEERGRLKYIDQCSDTLLVAPPLKGDPCLNHLHFPAGIDQTRHTHPSTRCGIVARGGGYCATPVDQAGTELLPASEQAEVEVEEVELTEGMIWLIPTDGLHGFRTDEETMDVIAYHPDSDVGPEHEDHPMVNRTWVGGEKIDNTRGVHTTADVVLARFDAGAYDPEAEFAAENGATGAS